MRRARDRLRLWPLGKEQAQAEERNYDDSVCRSAKTNNFDRVRGGTILFHFTRTTVCKNKFMANRSEEEKYACPDVPMDSR